MSTAPSTIYIAIHPAHGTIRYWTGDAAEAARLELETGIAPTRYARAAEAAPSQDAEDAARYRWLRSRDLDVIKHGGVFAGKTPDNVALNGEDLDAAIDAARAQQEANQ